MVLNSISDSVRLIHFQETQDPGIGKTFRGDDIRDMFLLQPAQPIIRNGMVHLDRYVIYDHVLVFNLQINGAMIAVFYIRVNVGIF